MYCESQFCYTVSGHIDAHANIVCFDSVSNFETTIFDKTVNYMYNLGVFFKNGPKIQNTHTLPEYTSICNVVA